LPVFYWFGIYLLPSFFKADIFLLWIGLAYTIPSIALFAQCLMSNPQLTLAAPFTSVLYLLGSWIGAYAISLKLNTTFQHRIAFLIFSLPCSH
jgi:hypothetical protein